MSIAYKCNRCGKLSAFENSNNPEDIYSNNAYLYTKGYYSIRLEKIPDIYLSEVHLCPECYNKLKDFVEGKDLKGEQK